MDAKLAYRCLTALAFTLPIAALGCAGDAVEDSDGSGAAISREEPNEAELVNAELNAFHTTYATRKLKLNVTVRFPKGEEHGQPAFTSGDNSCAFRLVRFDADHVRFQDSGKRFRLGRRVSGRADETATWRLIEVDGAGKETPSDTLLACRIKGPRAQLQANLLAALSTDKASFE